jgi:hypothetical protein
VKGYCMYRIHIKYYFHKKHIYIVTVLMFDAWFFLHIILVTFRPGSCNRLQLPVQTINGKLACKVQVATINGKLSGSGSVDVFTCKLPASYLRRFTCKKSCR